MERNSKRLAKNLYFCLVKSAQIMKNIVASLLLTVSFILPLSAWAQRIERTINESWLFAREGEKVEVVNIPHSWNRVDCVDDTPGYYRGVGNYTKRLIINDNLDGRKVYIYFEGANQIAEVWMNGQFVGKHIGGYSAFCFDVTEAVRMGENELKVKVDNSHNEAVPPLSADFTFFGGIYRDVNLIITPETHISTTHYASSGVYISTTRVTEQSAEVHIRTMLTNRSSSKRTIYLHHKIVSPEGNVVKEMRERVVLAPQSENYEHATTTEITTPQLWSPDTPHLYKVYTSLCDKAGNVSDRVLNTMGIRWFALDNEKGFFINGKHYKLMGTNRHQDYAGEANALSDARHIEDIRTMKEMGSNFLRISHYPQDRLVTRLCDRLGMVASVEIPIVNAVTPGDAFLENSLEMIREMVYQDYNSPSVMIWAYMNEVLLRIPVDKSNEAKVAEYYAEVYRQAEAIEGLLRKIDGSRLTMIPCHTSWRRYDACGILKLPHIVGWNVYFGWYSATTDSFARFVDKIRVKYPDKGMMISEYGADMDIRLHSFKPERFDYTCEYGLHFNKRYISEILKRNFIVGANVWNFNDFHSESRRDGIPHINNKGLVDASREKKDVFYIHAAANLRTPYLKIGGEQWRNRGGVTTDGVCRQPLSVFSNAEQVELFHNGKSLGKNRVVDFVAQYEVPFVDGENLFEAVADSDANICDRVVLPFKSYPHIIDADFEELNVLLGTVRYFDDRKDKIAWIPEKAYSEGSWGYVGGAPNRPLASDKKSTLPATMDIDFPNTENDPLWQTQRKGLEVFKADVPDGKYCVMLYFAEWESNKSKEALAYFLGGGAATTASATERIFDVSINGVKVLPTFNIAAEVGGEVGIAKKFTVDVANGEGITVGFNPINGEPALCAIRIYRVF